MQTRRELLDQYRRLRRRRGLTQEQLERLSGVSQQQISLIERCETEPRTDTLLALAAALGARLLLVSAEEDVWSPFKGSLDGLSTKTGVSDLIVPDPEMDA